MRLTVAMLSYALVLTVLAGCPHPSPPVPVGPPDAADAGQVDVFTGATVDCSTYTVQIQRATVVEPVRTCLAQVACGQCLANLATTYNLDVVACVARDLGASAQSSVQAGSTSPQDADVAMSVRAWIRSRKLGYR